MQLQLIRSATLLLNYAGQRILIDPYFAPKGSRPSFTGQSPNPLVELPMTLDEVLDGVELVIVSHLHSDHFDPVAQQALPKALPLLCQPGDEQGIRELGFQDVRAIDGDLNWHGINITRTEGHHGSGDVEAEMGTVSGFTFAADDEPNVYWAGDTIMCDEVRETISKFRPGVIVTHSSGAMWPDKAGGETLIVMDARQTVEVCRLAPDSVVIATHLDSLDHGTVSRSELRSRAQEAGIDPQKLRIPADGEVIEFA